MALEQQTATSNNIHARNNLSGKTAPPFPTQLELIPDHSRMMVSYFYVAQMRSNADIQQVRKALVPFAEQLMEHHLDLETRHLTLYYQGDLEAMRAALERLNLAAELQQTAQHYEPLEMTIVTSENSPLPAEKNEMIDQVFSAIWHGLTAILRICKRWIQTLSKKQDQ